MANNCIYLVYYPKAATRSQLGELLTCSLLRAWHYMLIGKPFSELDLSDGFTEIRLAVAADGQTSLNNLNPLSA